MQPAVKPKLIIFINTLSMGGAERVVSHLLNHLKADFDLHLALYSRQIEYDIPADIPVFDMGQTNLEKPLEVFLKIPLFAYRLYRYCRKHNIQTSVAFLNRPCYINALMRVLFSYRGKVIMCERTHQSTILASNSRLFRFVSTKLVSFAYKRADLVLVNSFASKFDLQHHFQVRKQIQVIYNPVDVDMIRQLSDMNCPFVFEKGIFHFIAVGGFRREKNLPILLDAFFLIRHRPVKLILVGSGVLEASLKQKVQDLGMGGQVHFTGFDNNPYKYIRRSDCLVLTSYVEGFPNVLLEALALEKPVISSDCKSGPRELLAPQSDLHASVESRYELAEFGILTPVNDVTILAEAMRRIMDDQDLREAYTSKAISRARQFAIRDIMQYFRLAFSGL